MSEHTAYQQGLRKQEIANKMATGAMAFDGQHSHELAVGKRFLVSDCQEDGEVRTIRRRKKTLQKSRTAPNRQSDLAHRMLEPCSKKMMIHDHDLSQQKELLGAKKTRRFATRFLNILLRTRLIRRKIWSVLNTGHCDSG
jgi:hypothetical protein